ncbi:DNA (cytosine-5-)-methyltransferase [Erythrobacter sp. 3-20A1M]|uniref:DNA (cytosine-5-)-methyltransferase n=1 Tax=Erythrobacter sp. 3-20A1M TaxID=2653850 RepID=UPI001BFC7246|nr:DNA (cytosine-5-)-methyltransferase [Erythrobacter sp. 3-20A1M]QWC58005.1 DNA (cytosine-5-)-methyltransferase [Erythrobacter sp. 3-20A1M]
MQATIDGSEALTRAREIFTQKELSALIHRSAKQIGRWEKAGRAPPEFVPLLKSVIEGRSPVARPEDSDFTFIDLFAGIGGIRIGFEQAGGRCVFTSEWDSYAQKTYAENFADDHDIAGDITQIDADEIPDHDVLLAGFPCQPFSLAGVSKKNALGKPHGFECTTQGTLFFDVQRIIAAKRPKAFLLENVKNLVSHDKGNTFRVIMDVLENKLGYVVRPHVVDGKRFVPQHRQRILLVGFQKDVGFDWDEVIARMPEVADGPKLASILHRETGSEPDVDGGRYLEPSGRVLKKYTLTDRLWQYLQGYAEKHRLAGNGFGCSVVGPQDTSRTLSARYYKDGSEILISRGKGRNPRRLTPRECARLMGYPDTFRIPVSDTRAYKQFGNSVVVPMMAEVARAMKPGIMHLTKDEPIQFELAQS